MGLLGTILGPRNSLLLLHDHLTEEGMEALARQIAQVGKFYRFVKLSEISPPQSKRNAMGCAALLFRNARKSLFLRAVPLLRGEGIPFTLFLRPDCIGLNRLPPEEELDFYRKGYPDRFPPAVIEDWKRRAWSDPAGVEGFLLRCRREVGPLPVGSIDPTLFFATWGKIVELPPRLLELGLYLFADPGEPGRLSGATTFIRQQTGAQVRVAFNPRLREAVTADLPAIGIEALVTPAPGAVTRNTDRMRLPCWPIDRIDEEENEEKGLENERTEKAVEGAQAPESSQAIQDGKLP